MKISMNLTYNIKDRETRMLVVNVARAGLQDTIIDITHDVKRDSPWLTGNNSRSIAFEVGPMGEVARTPLQAAVYSTSGYGGELEVGGGNRRPRPYFRPALDRHMPELAKNIKARMP